MTTRTSELADKRVLDFGGNKGNLLLDPACTIRHEDYYCLDIIVMRSRRT